MEGKTMNAETMDTMDGTQFLRNDQGCALNRSLAVTGDVGIGTASPSQSLDANGSINTLASVISKTLEASAEYSQATIDNDAMPNDARNITVTTKTRTFNNGLITGID
jgi:hypothetical protein